MAKKTCESSLTSAGADDVPAFFQSLRLDQKSLDERSNTIGGSDINIIASDDAEAIRQLYIQKRDNVHNDLSTVWPVVMGIVTEELNTEWMAWKLNSEILDRQRVIRGKKHPFMRCTLDGVIDPYMGNKGAGIAVFDAKFTLGRPLKGESFQDVIPRLIRKYTPQLHWNAYLLEEADGLPVEFGLLSIIRAGDKPTLHEIPINKDYQEALIKQAAFFMNSLKIGLEPAVTINEAPPIPAEDRVPYDMTSHEDRDEWLRLAGNWRQTKGAVETFKDAETEIKRLVPADASEAVGGGIRVKVTKNNRKTIEAINE